MLLPSNDPALTIKRILKVNHAGETGAIRIYAAQLSLARRHFPDVIETLDQMRRDEVVHCRLFREAMPARGARPCRVMSLWSLGGYVLGFVTALFGPRAVWLCTEAVEETVHRHLGDQLRFLKDRDPSLYELILSIQEQELAHLTDAREHQGSRPPTTIGRLGYRLIAATTEALIWLSTWGDSGWMVPEMRRDR